MDTNTLIFPLTQIHKGMTRLAGNKAANLGELNLVEGVNVPAGFCVSAGAFTSIVEGSAVVKKLIRRLSQLDLTHRTEISSLGAEIRASIEQIGIPEAVGKEVAAHVTGLDENAAYAIRSSATAEDLPGASFAGQQDSFLNVTGITEILRSISRCWASLFTERAILYRFQAGYDHRDVRQAVLVQRMVHPTASGILFTADPVNSNRKIVSIEAGFGLGDALVSGRVNADVFKVREGRIVEKKIATKTTAVVPLQGGGTGSRELEPRMQTAPVLTDAQVLALERLGRRIEKHFGCPQDIEWCLENNTFYVVQSRPVTTLYPVPYTADGEKHVFISVGHQQMMTDPISPLGLSMFQLTALRPMYAGGGRLFVDVASSLSTTQGREVLLRTMGQHDPLIYDALMTLIERGDFPVADEDGQTP